MAQLLETCLSDIFELFHHFVWGIVRIENLCTRNMYSTENSHRYNGGFGSCIQKNRLLFAIFKSHSSRRDLVPFNNWKLLVSSGSSSGWFSQFKISTMSSTCRFKFPETISSLSTNLYVYLKSTNKWGADGHKYIRIC